MASEARQVDMGVLAVSEFQPSQYSLLLKVTHSVGSASPVKPCMACHKGFLSLQCTRVQPGKPNLTHPEPLLQFVPRGTAFVPILFCVEPLTRFPALQTRCVQRVVGRPVFTNSVQYAVALADFAVRKAQKVVAV